MLEGHDVVESVKHGVDAASIFVVLATLAQWFPSVAALLTIVWTAIRIFETKTVQGWIGKRLGE